MSSIGEILNFFESLRQSGDDEAELVKRFGDERLYVIAVTREGEALYDHIALSRGEAEAYAAYISRVRRHTPHYALEPEPPMSARIEALPLRDVAADTIRRARLMERIEALRPMDREAIARLPEGARLLWHFDGGKSVCVPADEERIYQEVYADRLPEGIDYGDAAVVDEKGRFGIITNRTKLLGGAPDLAWVFGCRYAFVRTEGGLAELHEALTEGEDFLSYRCTVADTDDSAVYSRDALPFSLGYFGEFVEVTAQRRLRYVRVDKERREAVRSRPYAHIIRTYPPVPVQSIDGGLWGYIDKASREIIPCRYEDWGFFNDGYTIVKKDGRPMVIDISGHTVISPVYRKIEHYKSGYFFVQNDTGEWALFYEGEMVVDFVDPDKEPKTPKTHESIYDDCMDTDYQRVLISRLREIERRKLHRRYELPLKEYMKLFPTPAGMGDLERMGLLYHRVEILDLPDAYKDLIESEDGYIGWEYPSTASIFDMSEELPVMLTKKDGTVLSLGISFGKLQLKSD